MLWQLKTLSLPLIFPQGFTLRCRAGWQWYPMMESLFDVTAKKKERRLSVLVVIVLLPFSLTWDFHLGETVRVTKFIAQPARRPDRWIVFHQLHAKVGAEPPNASLRLVGGTDDTARGFYIHMPVGVPDGFSLVRRKRTFFHRMQRSTTVVNVPSVLRLCVRFCS